MLVKCGLCGTRYAAADTWGEGASVCPECAAPRERVDRLCGIAAHLSSDEPCPPGGCQLARALGTAPLGDVGDPCPVEVLALQQPDNPLVLTALDDLRREMQGRGKSYAIRVRSPRARPRRGKPLR